MAKPIPNDDDIWKRLSDQLQNSLASQMNQVNLASQQQYNGLKNALKQTQGTSMAVNNSFGSISSSAAFQQFAGMYGGGIQAPPRFSRGDEVEWRGSLNPGFHWAVEAGPDSYQGSWMYVITCFETRDKARVTENDIAAVNKKAASRATKKAPGEKQKAVVNFDTVVIEDEKRQQILEALEQINQNELIFEKWGFSDTIEKGKGVSMLFYGPPGTGKTLMAQAIANKLDYALKVISTADVESSAPGEAERNIRKHFKDAKDGKTILLFDECDSLIYTRQNVGPIMGAQINELLSQIERFDGITLFTTNRLGTLDEAVNRRLALKLEFAMPTLEQRVEIWKRMFPKKAPIDKGIDWERLAVVEVTGGYIKNAVLRAARMAAIQKVPNSKKKIKMEHLVKALKLEAESMLEFEKARNLQRRGMGVGEGGYVRTRGDIVRG